MNADTDPNQMIPRTAYRLLAEKESEVRAGRDRLRETLTDAREDFADLLRHHTRAIWALKGGEDAPDYPAEERSATGQRAQEALARIDAALNQKEGPT